MTKHIEIDCHFIREKFMLGIIQPEHLNTKEQIADLFTKALHPTQFKFLLSKLNISNIYAQLEGEYQSKQ